MSSSHPNANHTFSIQRRIPGSDPAIINTGISVYLEPKNGWEDMSRAGEISTGIYDGSCSKSVDLKIGDILIDETIIDVSLNSIKYTVVEVFIDMLFLNLIAHRTG